MHKSWLSGIVSAPLATALGALAIGITVAVALSIGHGGKLSTVGSLGLFSAVVLAVLAAGQASRPTKPDGRAVVAAERRPDQPDTSSERGL